ncbi:MAG TPA: DinB family protein [Candidatus Angelobacter sp.]|nr:DinB family protein [Candidatus Angelobacter sp.]
MTTFEDMKKELLEIRSRTAQLTRDLTPEQLTRRPDVGKWSIAECLLHLNLTGAGYQKLMIEAIRHGKERGIFGEGPFSIGFFGGLLRSIAEPPPKFSIKAPSNIAPPAAIENPEKVVADFTNLQDEWERLMKECHGLHLGKIKVARAFRGLPRLRLGASFLWMFAHQRRHLWQAENVKRQLEAAAAAAA